MAYITCSLSLGINQVASLESNVILDHPFDLSLNLIIHENEIVGIPSLLSGIDEI